MKKFLLPLAGAITATALLAGTAFAASTTVSGEITTGGSTPLVGASVTAKCVETAVTTSPAVLSGTTGTYPDLTFACPVGDHVAVTASKTGYVTNTSDSVKVVSLHGANGVATVNGDLSPDVVSVPEFGLLGASAAGLAGFGVLAITRRRAKKN